MITILGTIAIVLVTIGLGLLVDRKWDVIPRKQKLIEAGRPYRLPGHAPGEAPATARALSGRALARLRTKRCTCGGRVEPLPDDRVIFDGRELLVIHSRCTRCARARATYVRPA